MRVLRSLAPERSTQVIFEINDQLSDIEVAFEALDVITIWKLPNLELAIAGPVPLCRGQRFPTRVQQRGNDGSDWATGQAPTLGGNQVKPATDK